MCYANFHTHRPARPDEWALCCADPADWERLRAQAAEDGAGQRTRWAVGIHPWHAGTAGPERWEALLRALDSGAVCALGEVGLDACCPVPLDVQLDVFRRQALLAEERGLPLVVHVVRRVDPLLAERRRLGARCPWLWHGFRGGARQLQQLLPHGFRFGFGPRHRAEALAACPPDAFLPETDESDLPVSDVYRAAAVLRGESLSHLRHSRLALFHTLFGAP